ncbi:helix-turn-helix domain-containing protein [Streptomyces sp. NPDC091289]|uniref:helix-turn-helix domain-containing protein n=1 Tax=Streptomyces sp. NPDC091289 TaxID=3365989 RepID=UPI00382EE4BF
MALIDLFEADGFEVLFRPERMPLPASGLLETFPSETVKQALWVEGHILEVIHGLPPDAEPGTAPRPGYGPGTSVTSLQRQKAAELTEAGYTVAAKTIGNWRRRYATDGLVGLADHRPVRKRPEYGTVDPAVVDAMRQAIKEAVDTSTRNGAYLIWRTSEILRQSHREDDGPEPAWPSRPTSTVCWRNSRPALTPPDRRPPAARRPTERPHRSGN